MNDCVTYHVIGVAISLRVISPRSHLFQAIEAWMPKDIWGDVNELLVGFGQEIQTEKAKLLRKCLACSNPEAALELVRVCGVNVEKELSKPQPRLE